MKRQNGRSPITRWIYPLTLARSVQGSVYCWSSAIATDVVAVTPVRRVGSGLTNPESSPSTNRLRSSAETGTMRTQTSEVTIANASFCSLPEFRCRLELTAFSDAGGFRVTNF